MPEARHQRRQFYKWRAKYGGMDVSDAKRLRALREENAKLKKLLAESMLDVATLRELLGKHFSRPGRGERPWTGRSMRRTTRSAEPVHWSAWQRRPIAMLPSGRTTAPSGSGCGRWRQNAGASAIGGCTFCSP